MQARFTSIETTYYLTRRQWTHILLISGTRPVRPLTVSQSSTLGSGGSAQGAELAIDGDQYSRSNTICAWNTDLWYKMQFDAVYCFHEVVIIQDRRNHFAYRMDGTKVIVINSRSGAESLCGVLNVINDYSPEGQTYRIPCHVKCGDEVKLTLRHNSGEYSYNGCIHMEEITAFAGLSKCCPCQKSINQLLLMLMQI